MLTYMPALQDVQLGLEAAFGDAAAPTVQLVGITDCKITPKVEAAQIADKRGSTMPAYIATVNRLWGECKLSGILNYTHLRHWLDGIFDLDAGADPAYHAELVPAVDPKTYNIVSGQVGVCHGMPGAVMDSLTLSGTSNGPLTFDAHFVGTVPVTDTLAVIADPTVIVAMGSQVSLWIDDIAAAVGTTPITVTALSFDATITNGRTLVWHMGSTIPDNYHAGKWGGSLRLTVEMTAAMLAILDAALAATLTPGGYNIQLRATDSLATTVFTLKMAGHLLNPPVMYTDADGMTTAELEFIPAYSAAATMLTCWMADIAYP